MKLRIGIAGLGHMGKYHARALAELPDCDFAAVYDEDRAAAEKLATQLGTKAAASLDEFADSVDAAVIATPTPTHFSIAEKLLRAGKHLLVEKPITETTADARKLVEIAHEMGRVLQVGHVERFNPVMSKLEELLTQPRFIEVHRLSPYPNRSIEIGVVLDLMIHDLEIILHLVRSRVKSIDAVGVPVLSRGEDIATVRLHFENGCVANVTASRISPEKMRKIRVFQQTGYVSLDYQNQTGEIYRLTPMGIKHEAVEIEKGDPLSRELAAFVDCARRGAQPVVSGYEGAAALELAVEITRQIEAHAATLPRPGQAMKLYFVAGEASGDARGAELIRALRARQPGIDAAGFGGPQMAALATSLHQWIDRAGVIGVVDVLRSYGYFRAQFNRALAEIAEQRPEGVVLIDYPGFNLRLAKALKKRRYRGKIIHYISPQIWAWNRRRIPEMARSHDLMICIFPFEAPLYEASGLKAVFAGHPMLDSLAGPRMPREENLLGLFPGSREREVRKIFPVMLAASEILRHDRPTLRIEASAASEKMLERMREIAARFPNVPCEILVKSSHALMQRATAGMVASGTATLEAAYFELPFVLLYKAAWITFAIGRRLVKIRWLGMPNILADREVVREFLQEDALPGPIAAEVARLMDDARAREIFLAGLRDAISKLGPPGAAERAAEAILREIG